MEFVALPMPQLPNGLKVLIDLSGEDGELYPACLRSGATPLRASLGDGSGAP